MYVRPVTGAHCNICLHVRPVTCGHGDFYLYVRHGLVNSCFTVSEQYFNNILDENTFNKTYKLPVYRNEKMDGSTRPTTFDSYRKNGELARDEKLSFCSGYNLPNLFESTSDVLVR